MGRALAMRVRDALAAEAQPPEADVARGGPKQIILYRVTVFGRPRGPWRKTHREAMQDAIDKDLAAIDRSKTEYFLAVPTDIERCRLPR